MTNLQPPTNDLLTIVCGEPQSVYKAYGVMERELAGLQGQQRYIKRVSTNVA